MCIIRNKSTGHYKIIELLLDCGADESILDCDFNDEDMIYYDPSDEDILDYDHSNEDI